MEQCQTLMQMIEPLSFHKVLVHKLVTLQHHHHHPNTIILLHNTLMREQLQLKVNMI